MKGFWRGPNPYGPPPWARWWAAEEETPQPRWGWRWETMSKAERKAWLEAHKASLEAWPKSTKNSRNLRKNSRARGGFPAAPSPSFFAQGYSCYLISQPLQGGVTYV